MNQSTLLILVFCHFFHVIAQEAGKPNPNTDVLHPFRVGKSLVIGVFLGMVLLTFLHLAFLKYCHGYLVDDTALHHQSFHGPSPSQPTPVFDGVDRRIIESIPFFHFPALKGSKEGLECAVCISQFEDSDVLRLLPKCKHAFHMNCIDQWLETHSTCPLCRYKFDSRDLVYFTYSDNSLRLSRNPSNLAEDPNLELFVEREQDNQDQVQGSSSFDIETGNNWGKNQEPLIDQKVEGRIEDDGKVLLHKFKHKIIISDAVIKNRWSDFSPSDMLSLNSEMLSLISSKRFSSLESNSRRFPFGLSTNSNQIEKVKEDLERKKIFESKFDRNDSSSSSSLPSSSYNEPNSSKMNRKEKRSMSEIRIFPRVTQFSMKNQISLVSNNGKEEKIKRLWLPMVRKTVQWFSGQERYLQGSENNNRQIKCMRN